MQDYWLSIEYNNVKTDSTNVVGALNNPINIELNDEGIRTYVAAKMTGDDSFQDVRMILAEIETAKDIVNDVDFNMISATSMISHGVDADRFNEICSSEFRGVLLNTFRLILEQEENILES